MEGSQLDISNRVCSKETSFLIPGSHRPTQKSVPISSDACLSSLLVVEDSTVNSLWRRDLTLASLA